MLIRDRIVELRRVPGRLLRPNPKNWRTHPAAQRDALRSLLADVGYAGALVARQLDDGSLELIDGHLRAETTPEAIVPVLVLDVSAEEADKLLATFDPVGALAGVDAAAVERLLADVPIDNTAVQALVANLTDKAANGQLPVVSGQLQRTTDHGPLTTDNEQPSRHVAIPKLFQLVVECRNETQQRELYEQLTAEGYPCKVLTL